MFDDDQKETNKFDFPVDYFEDLFEFFSQYNFTIDENSPDEQEVGIDPEMLGHIFENLLEENKDKGAFYTPKEIVHYMCQESLIQYLRTHLSECKEDESPATIALENFIRKSDVGVRSDKNNFIVANASRIKKLLDNVKICDPAIGSGAFPMGMLQVIFEAKCILNLALTNSEKAKLKKEIIQKSIYGVDLEPGAVDIARLRFWLSLVVDEDEPQPLPNLDYKIMQGNSLLERIEDVDLSSLFAVDAKDNETVVGANGQMILGGGFDIVSDSLAFEKYEKDEFLSLVDMYFDFEAKLNGKFKTKQEVKHKVNTLIEGKLKAKFEKDRKDFIDGLAIKNSHLQSNEVKATDPVGIATKKEKTAEKLRKEIDVLERKITDLSLLLDKISRWENEDKERPYFLWHTYFKDVFDKGGFDIVIGNPPYIQLQKMGKDADALQKANYETFTRNGDIYCLFYEKGFDLLKERGVLTFITSNKWMRGGYGRQLRKYFSEINTLKVLNIGPGIFHSATVDTNIYVGEKSKFENRVMGAIINNRFEISNLNEKELIPIKNVNEDSWIILNDEEMEINKAFEKHGKQLNEWSIKINFGIKTGFNDAFIIDKKKRDEIVAIDSTSSRIIKPVLKGREIQKYYVEWKNDYIISTFPSHNVNIEDYKAVKSYLKSFQPKLNQTGETFINQTGEIENTRKKSGNKWFETQDPIAFVEEFKKEKLIWKRIGSIMRFAYSDEEIFCLDSTCIATGEKIKYLTAILNSKAGLYQLFKTSPQTGTGDQIISVQALEPLLVHYPSEEIERLFNNMVDWIIYIKKSYYQVINDVSNDVISNMFEEIVDYMVYELYFAEHMKKLEIDVLQFINFPEISTLESSEKKLDEIKNIYNWFIKIDNPIRNRILVSESRSWIIKRINQSIH